MTQTGVVAGGRLTDWISLGVLASWVPADAVDDAVEAAGRQAQRRGGKLPPRVTAYLVMALALFADEDYEEVAARLAGTLADWDGWEESWGRAPTSGGITQARQRLGPEPMAELEAAGLIVLADKGYQESTYAKLPYKGRNKPESQKQANRAHAKLRSPGERANAQLKTQCRLA